MPRRKRLRRVVAPPKFRGYHPYGCKNDAGEVELLYEEYESLKLADYDGMSHLEASEIMGVSRATFARIYESARKKIAKTLVEAKSLRSTFGNAFLDSSWYMCRSCYARFTIPVRKEQDVCPICKSTELEHINQ